MFKIVIITNKETDCIDKNIKLLKNQIEGDEIVIVNYNSMHLKYRGDKSITYIHNRTSKWTAIQKNTSGSNDIILLDNDVEIRKGFMNSIRKCYNPDELGVFRLDSISKDGKRAKSDYRLGANITTEDIETLSLCFNSSNIKGFNSVIGFRKSIITNNIRLRYHSKVKTFFSTVIHKPKVNDYSIIIPSMVYEYQDQVDSLLNVKEIRCLGFNPRIFTKYANQTIPKMMGSHVIIINPESSILDDGIINKINPLLDDGVIVVCNTGDEKQITKDSWVVFPKSLYHNTSTLFNNINDFQRYLLMLGKVRYIDVGTGFKTTTTPTPIVPVKKGEIEYSIIIPFMYNGDRYDIFKASLECLIEYTSKHSNIEIIVHETASKQHLTKSFIKRYGLVYHFSKWTKLFHRAWALNVPARHIAKGNTFIFFDADLLIDKKWIRELFNCDSDASYIGWGSMTNLNQKSTDHYVKTHTIMKNEYDRIRKPNGHAAGGGINIIPKHVFNACGGWPEDYDGLGYGGEDNSLSFKMVALGFYDQGAKRW